MYGDEAEHKFTEDRLGDFLYEESEDTPVEDVNTEK
jgi:hypothetical protein